MKLKRLSLSALALAAMTGACTPSLVYDPSLQMSHQPTRQGDVQAAAGIGYLLETRPDEVNRQGQVGPTVLLRATLSQSVSVGIRHWMTLASFEQSETYRSGIAGEMIIRLPGQGDGMQLALLPRAAMLIGGQSIEGGGLSLQAVATRSLSTTFGLYGGFGPVVGYRNLSSSANPDNQWGIGAIGNLGASLALTGSLGVGLEISGVGYYDASAENGGAGVSPTLFISYIF